MKCAKCKKDKELAKFPENTRHEQHDRRICNACGQHACHTCGKKLDACTDRNNREVIVYCSDACRYPPCSAVRCRTGWGWLGLVGADCGWLRLVGSAE